MTSRIGLLASIFCGILALAQSQSDFICVKDGMFAYNSCTQYVQCVYTGTPNAYKVLHSCPNGLLFDNSLVACNWANLVTCNAGGVVSTTGYVQQTTTQTSGSSNSPSFQEFSNALTQNGFPAPSSTQYTNFVNGMSSQGGITTKREAAMFLAQIMHESGGLLLVIETACGIGCVNCPYDYLSPGLDYPGKRYCGRGYIQLVMRIKIIIIKKLKKLFLFSSVHIFNFFWA